MKSVRYGVRFLLLTFRAIGIASVLIAVSTGLVAVARSRDPAYSIEEKSVAQLGADLVTGRVTSEALVRLYLARITAMDRSGPALHAVIATNPQALDEARAADARRRAGGARGPMDGIPILIKDNIETADGTATTAGSLALAKNVARRDAPLVARLRAAGAVVLGKTNLSEWANIRSDNSISGWSAVGGLVKNPYALDRNACGSSSGTGAGIAASFAAVGIGTETDGSITCPSSVNGLVGLKPTVGLVSRTHVVPISHSQDTPGPMGRSVADVAALLGAIAGSDPADPATHDADAHVRDYVASLPGASLRGKRLGVLAFTLGGAPAVDAAFARALVALRAAGADVVELTSYKPPDALGESEQLVLSTELKADLDAYLATTPAAVTTRTLADAIAFDARTPRELALFGQEFFERAVETRGLTDPAYVTARATSVRLAATEGIDRLLNEHHLDALIAPTSGPAWRTDVVAGDHSTGGGGGTLAAVAGYPHLTVPMGDVRGLPIGLSFIGAKWSEATLLQLGAAYERTTMLRRPPTYVPSIETTPEIVNALNPFERADARGSQRRELLQ